MIEQDAVRNEHIVGFAIVGGKPVSGHFSDSVRATRRKRRCFALRRRRGAVHLRRAGLVEPHRFFRSRDVFARRLEQAKRACGNDISGVFGLVEGDFYVTLCGQIINLDRAHPGEDVSKAGRIRQIAVMQEKACFRIMRIAVEMIDSGGVKGTGATDDTMDFIAFSQEEFSQIRSVLAGNAGNQCALHSLLNAPSPV